MSFFLSSNDDKAKEWLQFLDELAGLGIDQKQLPIPQIAVFGDQSSGKSSLLESISNIPFPKGTGLVTRCPTRISMIRVTNPNELADSAKQWSASIRLPEEVLNENDSVKDLFANPVDSPEKLASLLAEASKIVTRGSLNGFSKHVIHVTVKSTDIPDLSLIDLPGIIRTTTLGQDKSVINEVDRLLNDFMSQEETIILAVIPANQDIATIDILERAHAFDTLGVRTIGVLTKPDLVDRGAEDEVLSIVQNVRKPLKLGYIMVKNRNQQELKTQVNLSQALQIEEEYLSQHDIWQQIPMNNRGTRALCDKLTTLIVQRAMEKGPVLKYCLIEKVRTIDERLATLGTEVPMEDDDKRKVLIKILSRYTQTLRQVSAGEYRDILAQRDPEVRMKYKVQLLLLELATTLQENEPDLESEEYSKKLGNIMLELRGRELPGFGSTRLLLSTIAEELDSWRSKVENSMSALFELYASIGQMLSDRMTARFPKVNTAIEDTLMRVLSNQREVIARRIDEMFQYSSEGTSTDRELIETINNMRFSYFDQALKEVLAVAKVDTLLAGSPRYVQNGDNVPANGNNSNGNATAGNNNTNGSATTNASTNNNKGNTDKNTTTNSNNKDNHQHSTMNNNENSTNAVNHSNGANGSSQHQTPGMSFVKQRDPAKDALKQHVIELLGHAYMHHHSMGKNTILRLDEARAVLKCYWLSTEKRILEEVSQHVDLILLQESAEKVEQELLMIAQPWLTDISALNALFAEDARVVQERKALKKLKAEIEKSLSNLHQLIPNCPVEQDVRYFDKIGNDIHLGKYLRENISETVTIQDKLQTVDDSSSSSSSANSI